MDYATKYNKIIESDEIELDEIESKKIKEEEEYKKFIESERQKYKNRVEEEEKQAQIKRTKRKEKKKADILKLQIEADKLKEFSTGLIIWKRKDNFLIWDGYIDNKKCFKINHGIYKYSLSTLIHTNDKKDKNSKTSFELNKLQLVAESIAKKISAQKNQ